MMLEVFRFEILYRLRRPLLYVFAALFFLFTYGATSTDSVTLGGAIGNVARNAPSVIISMMGWMSALGLLFVTVFVAPSVNRDHEESAQELFFSTPMSKTGYLLGRYAGSVVPVILAMTASCLGIWISSLMPWQDPERIVPSAFMPYLYSMAVFVVPNLLLAGAISFSAATLTRKTFWAFVAAIAFMSLWGMGAVALGDLEHQTAVSLLDPFGMAPLKVVTRYWTIAERNSQMPPASGLLLVNRLLWIAAAAGMMALTMRLYRMQLGAGGRSRARGPAVEAETYAQAPPVRVPGDFGVRARLGQFAGMAAMQTRSILISRPFLVILMLGLANLCGAIGVNPEGTTSYPLTSKMLDFIEGAFEIMPWLVIIIYGAELVWRDRRIRIDGIVDALPVPDWINLGSRLVALWAIMIVMTMTAMACTVGYQAVKGYFDFQFHLYLKGLFIVMMGEWMLLCVLSLFLQTASGNRYVGIMLMVVALVALEVLPDTGHEHRLYLFGRIPESPWSDMNGYGHFAPAIFWFRAYWSLLAGILAVLAALLWVRGGDLAPAVRLRLLAGRLRGGPALALSLLALSFAVCGSWIYYNTNILNDHTTRSGAMDLSALYEERYSAHEGAVQPRLVAADVAADIYPESRRVDIGGTLVLINRSAFPIDTMYINIHRDMDRAELGIPGSITLVDDRETGFRICRLDPPMAPGDTILMGLGLTVAERGFMNGRTNVRILGNGTFFSNLEYIPTIGYDPSRELADPRERRKRGLPEGERLPPVDDRNALMHGFTVDADRIDFAATVSTSPDQIAIAPGRLEKEWMEGGRRFFRYLVDRPILNFYCFVSGSYAVERSSFGGIAIEVYHHPGHGMNVPRIMEAVTKALACYSTAYSPYPYDVLRIVEFPGYREFAQSFPTTIPFSEAAHFVEDIRDEQTVDMVFFITAHEVAHQWFAHQVTPARVQGGEMIGESLTQYAALMVMEEDYGPDRMRKFLRYELDRYLTGRSGELKEEMPLMRVEGQPYIHYHKGAVVMYAMRDYLGREAFEDVLRDYVRRTAFAGPPYTSTIEFISMLRPRVPERYAYLIEDLFETITLYDNRVEGAVATPTDDGRYAVVIDYVSNKMRSDGRGYETPVIHSDWIEIGVYGEETGGSGSLGKVLYQEKVRIEGGAGTIEVVVDEVPSRAGIDPRNILIDRVPEDNVKKVSGP